MTVVMSRWAGPRTARRDRADLRGTRGSGGATTGPGREPAPGGEIRVRALSCGPGRATAGYRMPRWARLSMTLIVTAALLVGLWVTWWAPDPLQTRSVVVQPGDTLTSVAVRDMPGLDVVAAVGLLASVNDLRAATLEPGSVIEVPVP